MSTTHDDKMDNSKYILTLRVDTNLNMIDRQLMSSGVVSLDAFFCHNTLGTVEVCELNAHPKLYGSHTSTVPIVL